MSINNPAKFLTIMSLSIFTGLASADEKPSEVSASSDVVVTAEEMGLLQALRRQLDGSKRTLNDLSLVTKAHRIASEGDKITQSICLTVIKNDPVKLSQNLFTSIADIANLLAKYKIVTEHVATEIKEKAEKDNSEIVKSTKIIEDTCARKFTI